MARRAHAKATSSGRLRKAIGAEWFLGISLATTTLFVTFAGKQLDTLTNPLWIGLIFIWLFGVVLGSALAVVRHADHVAEILGDLTARWFSRCRSPPSRCGAFPQ